MQKRLFVKARTTTLINYDIGPVGPNPEPSNPGVSPEYPTLIVMIAVLAIILLFCFWGAPGVRAYCQRTICYRCPMDEPRESSGTSRDDGSTTPTIILLPFGRMLVVDRNVISQLQADQTGIDFMELSANLIRAHQLRCNSTPSILDSETTSKGLSPISLRLSPPAYDDIFGDKNNDLPPSYSELSLLFRQRQLESNEMQSFNWGSMNAKNSGATTRETVLDADETRTTCDANEEAEGTEEEGDERKPNGENPTSVPSISLENGDLSYPDCKYCIMSYENERKSKITCYCNEQSDAKCVLMSRDGDGACSSNVKSTEIGNGECRDGSVERVTSHESACEIEIENGEKDAKNCECIDDVDSDDLVKRRSRDDIRESSL